MPALSDLVKSLPARKDIQMSSKGFALWVVWDGSIPSIVPQTFEDYGGVNVTSIQNQSLWFFFSSDVFLALARIKVWGKFNRLPLFIEVFATSLDLHVHREMLLVVDPFLAEQAVLTPTDLTIWIHPKAREGTGNLPGLSFEKEEPLVGMNHIGWELLDAEPTMPYKSAQGWYAFLRPLGRPLDKGFQVGWDNMYAVFEEILQRLKLRYLLTSNCFIISIENLKVLRLYVHELLHALESTKGLAELYWPCLAVIADQKQYAFNTDLINRINIRWSDIMADTPYITYRNAFLLGKGFVFNDLSYSGTRATMDSWAILSLSELQLTEGISIPVLISEQLVKGSFTPCFYCGARNHKPFQCPTRRAPCYKEDLWRKLAHVDIEVINETFREIESALFTDGLEGYNIFADIESPSGLLVQSVFEINLPVQVRMIEQMWTVQGHIFPKAMAMEDDVCILHPKKEGDPATRKVARDGGLAWTLLDRFLTASEQEIGGIERELIAGISRNPRDARLHSLQGFVALERGDLAYAQTAWRDAERVSAPTLWQSWHAFLQARLYEVQGKYVEAAEKYLELSHVNSQWLDVEYRQLVCRIKMGFAEQVVPQIRQMIEKNPYAFNRFLIDPELERGFLCILTSLYPLWSEARESTEQERINIQQVKTTLRDWFLDSDTSVDFFRIEIGRLQEISQIDNYVIFLRILRTHANIEKAITDRIDSSIKILKSRFKSYLTLLEAIRDEASWFPFPKVLVEFNRLFNNCATRLNWAFTTNFYEAQAFKRAKEQVKDVKELLTQLQSRLMVLRVVRDGTLCFVLLWRTFFWLEVIGVSICFVLVGIILFYGNLLGLDWLQNIIRSNHWEIQRMLVIIISMLSLGLSALRATLAFEKRRDQLVDEARVQRKEAQRKRLESLREQLRQQPPQAVKMPGMRPVKEPSSEK